MSEATCPPVTVQSWLHTHAHCKGPCNASCLSQYQSSLPEHVKSLFPWRSCRTLYSSQRPPMFGKMLAVLEHALTSSPHWLLVESLLRLPFKQANIAVMQPDLSRQSACGRSMSFSLASYCIKYVQVSLMPFTLNAFPVLYCTDRHHSCITLALLHQGMSYMLCRCLMTPHRCCCITDDCQLCNYAIMTVHKRTKMVPSLLAMLHCLAYKVIRRSASTKLTLLRKSFNYLLRPTFS